MVPSHMFPGVSMKCVACQYFSVPPTPSSSHPPFPPTPERANEWALDKHEHYTDPGEETLGFHSNAFSKNQYHKSVLPLDRRVAK